MSAQSRVWTDAIDLSIVCLVQVRSPPVPFPWLEPVEAVVVAHAVDDVGEAVAVHVAGEDLDARRAELPFGVPGPVLVRGIGRGLEPALGSEQVDAAVAVDVARADAVTGGLGAEVVLLQLVPLAVALLERPRTRPPC